MKPVKTLTAGLWHRYRRLPIAGQIAIALVILAITIGPLVTDDGQAKEQPPPDQRAASTSDVPTTTTEAETATATTAEPTTTTTAQPMAGEPGQDTFDDPIAQQAYDIERGICADFPPEEIAADAPENPLTMSPVDIAAANSTGYQPTYQRAAFLGCLAGFADQGYEGP